MHVCLCVCVHNRLHSPVCVMSVLLRCVDSCGIIFPIYCIFCLSRLFNLPLGASGNYVKMVHNGIEYGDMQLLADSYDLLRRVGGLTNEQLAGTVYTRTHASLIVLSHPVSALYLFIASCALLQL